MKMVEEKMVTDHLLTDSNIEISWNLYSSFQHIENKFPSPICLLYIFWVIDEGQLGWYNFCIPSLRYLHYETSNITRTSFADLSSLVCSFVSDDAGLFGGVSHSNVVNKLIGAFSNSKLLKLFGQWIEKLWTLMFG